MRSRNTQRGIDETAASSSPASAADRRRFLRLLATTPFAVQATAWLIACGGEQQEGPAPRKEEPREDTGGAGTGSSGSGDAGGEDTASGPGDAGGGDTASGAGDAGGDTASGEGGDGELVTEIAAMQPTVDALKYTHASTTEGQSCENCQFFTAKGTDRGTCQLFTQGLVTSGGWCSSWTKKIETS